MMGLRSSGYLATPLLFLLLMSKVFFRSSTSNLSPFNDPFNVCSPPLGTVPTPRAPMKRTSTEILKALFFGSPNSPYFLFLSVAAVRKQRIVAEQPSLIFSFESKSYFRYWNEDWPRRKETKTLIINCLFRGAWGAHRSTEFHSREDNSECL